MNNPATLKLALAQMTSGPDHAPNIATMSALAAEAGAAGCDMLALPEVAGMMNRRITEADGVGTPDTDPYIAACRDQALKHGIWIHIGSTPVRRAGEARLFNHSCLIDPAGGIVAAYDKIHLFDVYPEDAPPIQESKRYAPGTGLAMARTPWGGLGLSICYDLRFPQLYRRYAQAGAVAMFIPSAFTVPTGRAHWEVLLRARAIENGAFVIAAAQVGTHTDGRETYGHAMVVDPWGRVRVDMAAETGLAVVDLDIDAVAKARAQIPSLTHDVNFTGP